MSTVRRVSRVQLHPFHPRRANLLKSARRFTSWFSQVSRRTYRSLQHSIGTNRNTGQALDEADARRPINPDGRRAYPFNWDHPSGTAKPLDMEVVDKDGRFVYLDHYDLTDDQCHRIYDAIWRNMDRENNLINQRITWALILTAGFLTAETFIISKIGDKDAPLAKLGQGISGFPSDGAILVGTMLCAGLSALALFFSYLSYRGVRAAHKQMIYLKRRYFRLKVGNAALFQHVMKLPRPFGNRADHGWGNIAALFFPQVMMGVWSLFLFLEVRAIYRLWPSSLDLYGLLKMIAWD